MIAVIFGVAQLPPHLADVHVDAAIKRHELPAEHGIHQPLPCHHAPGLAQQNFEQIEFHRSKFNRVPRAQHISRCRIEFDVANSEHLRHHVSCSHRLRAAQDRPDSSHQFARVEWLRKIIVGADFQSNNAVDILAARRQQQYRNLRHTANAPQHFEAIDAREHYIEDNQCIVVGQCLLQALFAVVDSLQAEPFRGQIFLHQGTQFDIVVYHQHVIHTSIHLTPLLAFTR